MFDGWGHFARGLDQARLPLSRVLLRRMAGYGRPYLGRISLMIGAIIFGSLLSLIPPLFYREFIDQAAPRRDLGQISLLALGMIAIPLLRGLVLVAQRYLGAQIGSGVVCDLRRALFSHLQQMSYRFFTTTPSGELISRLSNDVLESQQVFIGPVVKVATNLTVLVFTLAIMVTLEWRLTVVVVSIFPLFILPGHRLGRVLERVVRQQMEHNSRLNSVLSETLNVSGALLAKLYSRGPDEIDRFGTLAGQVREAAIHRAIVGRWFFLGLTMVTSFGLTLVFWIGGFLVIEGTFTIGTIIAFTAYLAQLYSPLASLTSVQAELTTAVVSFERVFEVLDLPIEISEPAQPAPIDHVQGRVRFENVWFDYPPPNSILSARRSSFRTATERAIAWDQPMPATFIPDRSSTGDNPNWVLSDLSFDLAPGEFVALVGPSGAGKTTIAYLLARLYDPTKGRITLDGHDLRQISLRTRSESVGMVTQDCYLFNDSIRANLSYARPGATMDQVEDACRAANVHNFIISLPNGYDTIVGERGYALSGGEKQRLAIARVLLKDPRILVLDEATSHLDSRTEVLIQTSFEQAMKGRASLVIAHRLSTVLAADRILVLNRGRVVEQGTHAELLSRDGLYSTLYTTQFHAPRSSSAPSVVG